MRQKFGSLPLSTATTRNQDLFAVSYGFGCFLDYQRTSSLLRRFGDLFIT